MLTVQQHWDKFTILYDDFVFNADPEDEENDFMRNDAYTHLEIRKDNFCILLKDIIEKSSTEDKQDVNNHNNNTLHINLPPVNVPHFHGNYLQWRTFYDQYTRLIHDNKMLSPSQKMSYLKASLGGPAASRISHLQITDDNYSTAWEMIIKRFENKRVIVMAHIDMLLSQPTLSSESSDGIKNLHDKTTECIHALNNLDINTTTWDPILLNILTKKLDSETHRHYEEQITSPKELQSLQDFIDFLENRFQILESINKTKIQHYKKQHQAPVVHKENKIPHNYKIANTNYPEKQQQNPKLTISSHTSTQQVSCRYCKGEHSIITCTQFRDLEVIKRNNFIQKEQLCKNCMGHDKNLRCFSLYNCRICNKRHHTSLHIYPNKNEVSTKSTTSHVTTTDLPTTSKECKSIIPSMLGTYQECNTILLATALIKTTTVSGHQELLRCLIDPGSQATFISERAAQTLNHPRKRVYAEISGMANCEAGTAKGQMEFGISPRYPSTFKLNIKALILPNLTKPQPSEIIKLNIGTQLQNILLADPTYDTPGPIDVLIGADYYGEIILDGIYKFGPETPIAQKTELGWILSGKTGTPNMIKISNFMVQTTLDDQLKKFWEIEEIPAERKMTKEEQECEEIYEKTHSRGADGRYTVCIPFTEKSNLDLGNSRQQALARFLQLERKFKRNPKLKEEYIKFINEYKDLNHMKPVPKSKLIPEKQIYFLPHHAVFKETSSSTKLRVVFDGSAKTTTGCSLNDKQMVGPSLQQDLGSILLRWRTYRYVYTADIEKMYRQVKINEQQQDFQRILWRNQPSEEIQEYKLTTVTYGTSAASYLAIKTLQQLAKDEAEKYPLASEVVLRDFYVDDVMSGSDTLQKALDTQHQLILLLRSGGFHLRKWNSNDSRLLDKIPTFMQETGSLEIEESDNYKTLGVFWNPHTDNFYFKVSLTTNLANNITKRELVSQAARLFDPLGWLAPVTINAKILIQKLWIAGIKWDQELPTSLANEWIILRDELKQIEAINIPRWIQHEHKASKIELHGFCDASELAYAAAIYLKTTSTDGETHVNLLTAKTKVAPIKNKISLPRLELCAAELLANLIECTTRTLNINANNYAWTDSTIVLAWIRGNPGKWKTFVANRVSKIQNIVDPANWNHVRSGDNPTDCASRGIRPSMLKEHPLWWTGPTWLKNEQLPIQNILQPAHELPTTELELRYHTAMLTTKTTTEIQISDFATFKKLRRVMAYCLRFKHKRSGPLSANELLRAEERVILNIQHTEFHDELRQLATTASITKKSHLLALKPFIDEKGYLRVGGRLQESHLPFEEKHPIIIPRDHYLATLIIDEAHQKTMHGGTANTLAYIRRKYWILNARDKVSKYIHKCMKCFRYTTKPQDQIMGNLPKPRITPSRPFCHTGIDYAGPIQVRASKGRGYKSYKGYIAIFVCLCTKAIHIEVVSDLTTAAFLAAFKRFTARRGLCTDIYSDCGTNFIGARTELNKNYESTIRENLPHIAQSLANDGTEWHFIPPASPHFGGLWEAGVKSTKYHLKRIIGDTTLTFEELSTVLTQIEGCLNSRPLCPMTADPTDLQVLTPAHFLIGNAIVTPPEPTTIDTSISLSNRWMTLRRLTEDFWRIWSREYLARLQQRPKWLKATDNIKINDLVLIKDERMPPSKWILGRITEVHPGADGRVRVATLRCSGNQILKRSISKLCPLPSNEPADTTCDEGSNPIIQEHTTTITSTVTRKSMAALHRTSRPKTDTTKGVTEKHNMSYSTPSNKRIRTGFVRPLLGPLFYIATMLSIFCMTSINCLPNPVQITPFVHQPGLYFEDIGEANILQGEWDIVLYYNLTTYWEEFDRYKHCVSLLQAACKLPRYDDIICRNIYPELEVSLQQMISNNNLLIQSNKDTSSFLKRTKRGLFNLGGTILHEAFGVMDEEHAKHLETQISNLQLNQQHLLHLIKNQTSIVDLTTNIIHRMDKTLHTHITSFERILEEMVNNTKLGHHDYRNMRHSQRLTSIALHTALMMIRFINTQFDLMDTITDIHHGKINPRLLTPIQLENELQKIQEHLPHTLTFLKDGNGIALATLYKEITAKSRVLSNMIIINAKLPLLNHENYQLFRLLPVPIPHENFFTFINPSSDYLMINLQRDKYYQVHKDEFQRCKIRPGSRYICKINRPLYNSHSGRSKCELNLLRHVSNLSVDCNIIKTKPANTWVKMEHPNRWIYALQGEQTFDTICGAVVSSMHLRGNGILELSSPCSIKGIDFNIKAWSTIHTRMDSSYLPSINLSLHVSNTREIPKISIPSGTTDDLTMDLARLHMAINNQRQEEVLSEGIDGHNIHHYTVSYTIIAALIATAVYLTWTRLRTRVKRKEGQEATAIELSPMASTNIHSTQRPVPKRSLWTIPEFRTESEVH